MKNARLLRLLGVGLICSAVATAPIVAQEIDAQENASSETVDQSAEDPQSNETIQQLTEEIERDPENAEAYALRGSTYFLELDDKENALPDLNKAVELFTARGDTEAVESVQQLIAAIEQEIAMEQTNNPGNEDGVTDVVVVRTGPFRQGDVTEDGREYVTISEDMTEVRYPTGMMVRTDRRNNSVKFIMPDGREAVPGDVIELIEGEPITVEESGALTDEDFDDNSEIE